MKILLVAPGATWSTYDVFTGYLNAFKEKAGIEVIPYMLHDRIIFFNEAMETFYKKRKRKLPEAINNHVSQLATDGVLSEALRNQVDLVFFISCMSFHPDILILLKRAGIETAIYYTECPYDDKPQTTRASFTTYNFVCDLNSVEMFKMLNPNTWYLPHSFNPAVHHPGKFLTKYGSDVVFIGTGFPDRIRWLEEMDWTGIDLKLLGYWHKVSKSSPLKKFVVDGCVNNTETVKYYQSTKIAVNLHRVNKGSVIWDKQEKIAKREAYSLNPRTYEIAACRTFQITDKERDELAVNFDSAIPMAETPKAMEELIVYYLDNKQAREWKKEIAYEQVKNFTFEKRVDSIIIPALKGGDRHGESSR